MAGSLLACVASGGVPVVPVEFLFGCHSNPFGPVNGLNVFYFYFNLYIMCFFSIVYSNMFFTFFNRIIYIASFRIDMFVPCRCCLHESGHIYQE